MNSVRDTLLLPGTVMNDDHEENENVAKTFFSSFESIPIPNSLATKLNTSRLESTLTETRSAVRTNAIILSLICDKFETLFEQVEKSEKETQGKIEKVVAHVDEAVKRAEAASEEVQRVSRECVPRSVFEAASKNWEERLARLESVNRELLEKKVENEKSENGNQEEVLTTFVTEMIKTVTALPMKQLYGQITFEWDGAFNSLSDAAFKEIHEAQADVQLSRRETLQQLELVNRDSMEATRQMVDDNVTALKETTQLVCEQTRSSIEVFGFDIRREVSSMLFHTRNQTATLQRAITKLRNTLCLPPDSETVETTTNSMHSMSMLSKHEFFSPTSMSPLLSSPVVHRQLPVEQTPALKQFVLPQMQQQIVVVTPPPSSQLQEKNPRCKSIVDASDGADFGKESAAHKHRRRIKRVAAAAKNRRSNNDNNESNEDEDALETSSESSSDAEATLDRFSSVLIPIRILEASARCVAADNIKTPNEYRKNSKNNLLRHDTSFGDSFFGTSQQPQSAATTLPVQTQSSQQQQQLIQQNQQNAASSFRFASSQRPDSVCNPPYQLASGGSDLFTSAATANGNDIKMILQTPIFVALRDLVESSARAEIDALNTLRESQFVTEIEDLRKQVMRKVSLDMVHKLIERSRDRTVSDKVERVSVAVAELQMTVIRASEWQSILKSKADFSAVDQVRVEVSRRCQFLEDDVQRLERAVVIGFGENLQVAPPATFRKIEVQRVEAIAEQKRLFLERGSIDDTLEIVDPREKKNVDNIDGAANSDSVFNIHQPHAPVVEDARSVVVSSPRQFLHSTPPSRSVAASSIIEDAPNMSSPSSSSRRVASAGRGRFSLMQHTSSTSRGGRPTSAASTTLYDDVVSDDSTSGLSASNSAHRFSATTTTTIVATPPPNRFGAARPATAAASTPSRAAAAGGAALSSDDSSLPPRPNSASVVFHDSLRVRCGLNEDEVRNWGK